jgi:hypothetical protein
MTPSDASSPLNRPSAGPAGSALRREPSGGATTACAGAPGIGDPQACRRDRACGVSRALVGDLPAAGLRQRSSALAPGLPLALHLEVQSSTTCKPIEGANVEIWHANVVGVHSGYGSGSTPGGGGAQARASGPSGGGHEVGPGVGCRAGEVSASRREMRRTRGQQVRLARALHAAAPAVTAERPAFPRPARRGPRCGGRVVRQPIHDAARHLRAAPKRARARTVSRRGRAISEGGVGTTRRRV